MPSIDDEDDDGLDPDRDLIGDIDDADEMAEDEDGIDLFRDNFEKDYKRRENDAYKGLDIDDEGDYEDLNLADRRQLEARLHRRDRELARQRRMAPAFLQDEEDEEMDLSRQPRRKRRMYDEDPDDMDMDENIMDEELSLETLQDVKASSLQDWVALPAVYRSIFREFKSFLTEYTERACVRLEKSMRSRSRSRMTISQHRRPSWLTSSPMLPRRCSRSSIRSPWT